MRELTGRVAVVTGGGGGIGRGLAEALAADGMRIVLADVNADRLDKTVANLRATGGAVVGVPTDVADPAAVDALADAAISEFGSIDLVCNNAGIWRVGYAWETDLAAWQRIIDVNLGGVINGVRTFVPVLLENPHGGHIVNVSSMAGLVSGPTRAPYAATKHAVVGLSKSLREEMRAVAPEVKVSVVCPGKVNTSIFDDARSELIELAADGSLEPETERVFRTITDLEGMSSREAGEYIRDGIVEDRFWIFPGGWPTRAPFEADVREILAEFDRQGPPSSGEM